MHESLTTPEAVSRSVQRMYIFDVDGPVVEPTSETITHPEILSSIIDELSADRPVALITGRGIDWLINGKEYTHSSILSGVVGLIEQQVNDKSVLDNFFVSAEFGGCTITYRNGEKIVHVQKTTSLPQHLLQTAEQLIQEKYSETMMVEPKLTHFTAKIDTADKLATRGKTFADFKNEQTKLVKELESLLKQEGLSNQLEIHQDRIATNIRYKHINKSFATKEVLKWLREKRIDPQLFVVFGDNRGDFEIADALTSDSEIQERKRKIKVVYLGSENQIREIIDLHPQYEIEIRHHDDLTQGTADFLQEQKLS